MIVEMNFGSKVYGTSTPESDTDYKGIDIPAAKDILLQKAFRSINTTTGDDFSRNTKDDIDREIFSLHQYMKLVSEGQTAAMDMLFTPKSEIIKSSALWDYITNNKEKLLSKQMSAFAGYCKGQAAKYSLKGDYMLAFESILNYLDSLDDNKKLLDYDIENYVNASRQLDNCPAQLVYLYNTSTKKDEPHLQVGPKTKVPLNAKVKQAHSVFKEQLDKYGARAKAAKDGNGVDWKALYHAVRICDEGIELLKTGHITFPRPNANLLLSIRKGNHKYEEVASLIDEGLIILDKAKEESKLQDEPDRKWMENLVLNTYFDAIRNMRN